MFQRMERSGETGGRLLEKKKRDTRTNAHGHLWIFTRLVAGSTCSRPPITEEKVWEARKGG